MFTKIALRGNYGERRNLKNIGYIVIHYTAGNNDTARGNLSYFASTIKKSSAHLFVDERESCCSVPIDFVAWHCGAKSGGYRHNQCRNANSIGIEMCTRRLREMPYLAEKTVENTAKLTAEYMKKFNIPIENILRHYDVTGKNCPAPLVIDKYWVDFKNRVMKYLKGGGGNKMKYYAWVPEMPQEYQATVQKLYDAGVIKGTGDGLHLSDDMCRLLVYNDRAGIYDRLIKNT